MAPGFYINFNLNSLSREPDRDFSTAKEVAFVKSCPNTDMVEIMFLDTGETKGVYKKCLFRTREEALEAPKKFIKNLINIFINLELI